jgi:asparagine synthase (glutamine-hydrolysing)
MCGIAGIIGSNSADAGAKMRGALQHRGPDDQGAWVSDSADVYLAHTRLAIIDLSPAGHQPMLSADQKQVLVFNGEIYNYAALRDELIAEGCVFHSHTDTEVILQGCRRFGPSFISRLRGMFAFCLWDTTTQTALLARDPLGIKPLYWSDQQGALLFASEIRALLACDLIPRKLDATGVAGFFASGSVPEPRTLIQNVSQLRPGHYMTWHGGAVQLTNYWKLTFPVGTAMAKSSAVGVARQALEDSINAHLVSDVPVGLFLSGGIDSTALLALTRQAQPDGVIKTFSISVDDSTLDEASTAAATASHFGTEHREFKINADIAAAAFPDYLASIDSPSVDGFNTWMVARFAREHGMKVVLSGLGGDELLAGYNTFLQVPKLHRLGRLLSWTGPIKWCLAKLLSRSKKSKHQRLGEFLQGPPTLGRAYAATRGVFSGQDAAKLAEHFCQSIEDPHNSDARAALRNIDVPSVGVSGRLDRSIFKNKNDASRADWTPTQAGSPCSVDARNAVSALELTRYMRNQLLKDSDVMSMAHGLELRVPLVDAVLFDQLAQIPSALRLEQGKKLLLAAVPEVPQEIACAPKRGFSFPFAQWLSTSFGSQFKSASEGIPVSAHEWYQQWALFVFREWCQRLSIEPVANPTKVAEPKSIAAGGLTS